MWTDTHLDAGLLTVTRQLVVDGWEVYEDAPRPMPAPVPSSWTSGTVEILRQHRV
ncbi:hypothetical protein ABZ642_19710 [Streptomyces sp. NPDC007157]|uniref:hypothetical protein n=1 Tax=Streptomyces sp. NPDC007157 TaxID=3154681 RepID=UPI0033FDD676